MTVSGELRPVVLVHGLFATPTLMRPLRRQLRRLGHDTHLVPELGPMVMGDVRQHAEELERAVERVRRKTGADRVDVVGTSQGGLVAFWWAHALGWERLGRLVTLGTPFRGAPVARLARPLGWLSKGIRQVHPDGAFIGGLPDVPLRRPVTSISMARDPVCPPAVCNLPGSDHVTVPGGPGPFSHQAMMFDPRVVRVVHEVLVKPC